MIDPSHVLLQVRLLLEAGTASIYITNVRAQAEVAIVHMPPQAVAEIELLSAVFTHAHAPAGAVPRLRVLLEVAFFREGASADLAHEIFSLFVDDLRVLA